MSTKPLILITGATGLLGFRTLVLALQAGYRARIVYRRDGQPEQIRATKSIQPHLSDTEVFCVSDMTASDAFDDAVRGVDFVVHIASPVFEANEEGGEVVSHPLSHTTECQGG